MRAPYSVPPVLRASRKPPTFVDLFAGCGGLGLGLEIAGFMPLHVNELDPSAMATYVGNRLRTHPHLLKNRSFDITELTGPAQRKRGTLTKWSEQMLRDHGEVGLVCGGPPCQGYSGIGHRRSFEVERHNVPSNHLYKDMAAVIKALRPRVFLFENVENLKVARWYKDGDIGEIWRDVYRTFQGIDGYDVRETTVHARDYGVPQNRPRVLVVGIRTDLGHRFTPGLVAEGLLPQPTRGAPDPIDFLGDLVDEEFKEMRDAHRRLATVRYPKPAGTTEQTWYRTDPITGGTYLQGDILTEQEYSRHHPEIVRKFEYMIATGGEIAPGDQTKKFSLRLLRDRWPEGSPNITATSLPDDYVHFSQPRTLTVREWARLQTFPDWYQFHGKRTTGGRRRAGDPETGDWSREVPKYTQIGNAVPVLLGYAVGQHLAKLIS